jgi:hypothetical protein
LVVSWTDLQCPLPLALLVLCDVRRVKVPVHDPRPCRSMRHAQRGKHLHIIKCLTYKKINSGPTKSQNELILSMYLKVLLLGQRHLSCTIFLEGLFLDGPVVVDVGLESRLVNHVTDMLLTGSVCRPIRHLLSTVFWLEVPLHTNTMYSFIISIKDLTNGGDVLTFIVRHLPKNPPKLAPACCPARHPSRACTCPTTRPVTMSRLSTSQGQGSVSCTDILGR